MLKKTFVFVLATLLFSNFFAAAAQEKIPNTFARVKFNLTDFRNPSQLRGRFGLLQFSPDGKSLATSGTARDLKIYDTNSGKVLATLDGDNRGFNAFSFNPDSKTAIAQDTDFSELRVFDIGTGKVLKHIDGSGLYAASKKVEVNVLKGLGGLEMSGAPITPDWTTVLIQKNEGEYQTVDIATNEVKYKFNHSKKSSAIKDLFKTLFVPFSAILVPSAAFSPNGKRVVIANGNTSPSLWNAADGNLIARLEPQDDRVYQAVFSPDGKLVATFNIDGIVKIWDGETGKMLASFGSKKERIVDGTWSADSRKFVTVSIKTGFASFNFKKDTPVWDARNGEILFSLENSFSGSAVFSPDGKLVATNNLEDKTIMAQIWNAETGALVAKIPRTKDEDRAMLFVWSPDSKYLVAPTPQFVKVWSASGEFVQLLENAVFPARFNADGKLLATGGKNDIGYVWQIGDK